MTTQKDSRAREEKKARAKRVLAAHAQARDEEREALADLEEVAREEAMEREANAKDEAAERIKAISRASGSHVASFNDSVARFEEWARQGSAIIELLNRRYEAIPLSAAESDALVERCGVRAAKLPEVLPPDADPRVVAVMRSIEGWQFRSRRFIEPRTEACEHGLRRRRSYQEIAGTPAYEIISRAGLKPFPELTEKQREIVAGKQRELQEEGRSLKQIAPLARETTAALGMLPRGVGVR